MLTVGTLAFTNKESCIGHIVINVHSEYMHHFRTSQFYTKPTFPLLFASIPTISKTEWILRNHQFPHLSLHADVWSFISDDYSLQ